MNVVDHSPHAWFLLQRGDDYFLDVNCNHSAAGYSILIRLAEDEVSHYSSGGHSYVDRLAQAVQDGGPGSPIQSRDVTTEYLAETSQAIKAWRVSNTE
jgi:hypothetical protein